MCRFILRQINSNVSACVVIYSSYFNHLLISLFSGGGAMITWFLLRKFLRQIELDPEYKKLGALSLLTLEWIALRSELNKPLLVQEIVMQSCVASPAAIHKCIAALQKHGLISVAIDPIDSGRRVVKTTNQADRLFMKLSKKVDDWILENIRSSPIKVSRTDK